MGRSTADATSTHNHERTRDGTRISEFIKIWKESVVTYWKYNPGNCV
jgi:hypothetical protein